MKKGLCTTISHQKTMHRWTIHSFLHSHKRELTWGYIHISALHCAFYMTFTLQYLLAAERARLTGIIDSRCSTVLILHPWVTSTPPLFEEYLVFFGFEQFIYLYRWTKVWINYIIATKNIKILNIKKISKYLKNKISKCLKNKISKYLKSKL